MVKAPALAALMGSLLLVAGCAKKPGAAAAPAAAEPEAPAAEPLRAAFSAQELGDPVDWKSLTEKDKALLDAFINHDVEKAKAALKQGANPNLRCGRGLTTVMLAAAMGSRDLVAALREAGARDGQDAGPYLEILEFPDRAKGPEFRAALGDIERATGKPPVARGTRGEYAFELPADKVRAFLDGNCESLLKKGCFVFVNDQHFGINGKPDALLALPTTNQFAVMAYAGVDGANYDIDNYLVIKWMKRLDAQQPYRITACGGDFISGRFKGKIADPAAMAKAMYDFCPDIVDQGVGSVEALAKELAKTGELYFWWD